MCFLISTRHLSTLSDFRILDDEWEMTRFKLTPRMSTYLFAFTVSEFEEFTVSKPTPENVDVKVCVHSR